MTELEKFEELKELAIGYTLLYVEDNKGLREQATKIFTRIFGEVVTAEDGLEGLEIFKKLKPKLVITDIKMPGMDGLEMTRKIHQIAPQTKVIITSTYNDTEYLMEAINAGVFRYLTKPINIVQLTSILLDGLKHLKAEDEERLFTFYVKNIFNYQESLLIMYCKGRPVIVNSAFLEFFEVENIEQFIYKFGSLDGFFLPHDGFLYDRDEHHWFQEAMNSIGQLYHVKMNDPQGAPHHFIFKMIAIEGKEDYYLVSMNDVTELGLLKLFNRKSMNDGHVKHDTEALMRLLETAKHNQAVIRMQNFYKGLTIANKGLVETVNKNSIEFRTAYLQQKGAQYEGSVILSSELFPFDILCQKIKGVNFDRQTIEVDDPIFIRTSPSMRQSVRLEPDDKHSATLLFEGRKFGDGVRISDISVEAVRLSLSLLPAGFDADAECRVDMVFNIGQKPLIINTPAKVYEIRKLKKEFEVIMMLHLTEPAKKLLVDYLAHRQIELIREFKGLQYGH